MRGSGFGSEDDWVDDNAVVGDDEPIAEFGVVPEASGVRKNVVGYAGMMLGAGMVALLVMMSWPEPESPDPGQTVEQPQARRASEPTFLSARPRVESVDQVDPGNPARPVNTELPMPLEVPAPVDEGGRSYQEVGGLAAAPAILVPTSEEGRREADDRRSRYASALASPPVAESEAASRYREALRSEAPNRNEDQVSVAGEVPRQLQSPDVAAMVRSAVAEATEEAANVRTEPGVPDRRPAAGPIRLTPAGPIR